MKILVISDKESEMLTKFYHQNNLDEVDFILSVGDLPHAYLESVKTNLNKPLLYINGNHDLYKTKLFDKNFIEWKCAEICGVKIVGIGCKKREEKMLTEAEMSEKLNKLYKKLKNKKIDIVISHYPAAGIGDGDDATHKGYQSIKEFVEKIKPTYFVYGHNHLNYNRTSRMIEMDNIKYLNAYEKFILDF